jgi:acyl-CoA dehydrogenase
MFEENSFYDPSFERRVRRLLGERYDRYHGRLQEMGRLAAEKIDGLAAEADKNPPQLVCFDREGRRVDQVRFHASYEEMRRLAYGSGMIAGAYTEKDRDPKVVTFALGLIFGMAESGLFCPICMTDGAARVIERFAAPELVKRFVPRLGATESPWEGAMWLTERQGGSDVGANSTIACDAGDGTWRLTGEKFFCSNLGAEVTLALARPEGAPSGTAGLSLFIVPLHVNGKRNGLVFRKLKDKLGTRSMPTGEVELEDAVAYPIAGPGQGFKAMAEMLNLSRMYNAVASCAGMRRGWREAALYAEKRSAFGKRLADHPLQQEIIADLAVETEAATALVFEAIRRLDRIDAGSTDATDKAIWRTLTPLIKLYTGKQAVWAASEAIEALGGNGYMEDYPTARLLRDAQVLPIWEGTTNILSLDFLFRACGKERGHEALFKHAEDLVAAATNPLLEPACAAARALLDEARAGIEAALALSPDLAARDAREIARTTARAIQGALLLDEANETLGGGDARSALVALRLLGCSPSLNASRYVAIVGGRPISIAEALHLIRPEMARP